MRLTAQRLMAPAVQAIELDQGESEEEANRVLIQQPHSLEMAATADLALVFARGRKRPLAVSDHYSSSDDDVSVRVSELHRLPPLKKQRSHLDFFMSANTNRDPLSSSGERISGSQTRIGGQIFGKCELTFGATRVSLMVWARNSRLKRVWKGPIKYAHLSRLSLFRGQNGPPYLLLLELKREQASQSQFSEFYDTIYAQVAAQHHETNIPGQSLYGAVFYFDHEEDYVRCRTMAESFTVLEPLLSVEIPENEALPYLTASHNSSKIETRNDTRLLREQPPRTSAFGGGIKRVLNFASSWLTSGQQTINPLRTGSGDAWDEVKNATTSIADQQESTSAEREVVEIHESPSQRPVTRLFQDNGAQPRETSVASRMKDIQSRRSETLLLYPYEDAEASGRISVTYGDIDRLAPGEFLNDNIIDFYLRFLWRHLEPWQQEHMYFFSSHFFTQLNGSDDSPLSRFSRVSRWTQKETNLFEKRFLFIPINDSFHWSVAVVCNPASAIVHKRKIRRRQRVASNASPKIENGKVVNLVENFKVSATINEHVDAKGDAYESVEEEEEMEFSRHHRLESPPCILFMDSLRCHRKKKFAAMIREYLECEWNSRFMVQNGVINGGDRLGEEGVSTAAYFNANCLDCIEPEIPMQSNSSDCGVFLLMYAAEIARRFPSGITQEDLAARFSNSLSKETFDENHVREFRGYLHQLLFCLQSLQQRGISEHHVKDEELESFVIDQ